ncbi:hypothetical protein [Saccharothrix sp.]|uniref:hypothetical protein n=1 Tax=Saccharothrix sp. TaxID=1873460 RepID=UPI002812219D|nr:hypothetical protein [Saccharothrix sp.]
MAGNSRSADQPADAEARAAVEIVDDTDAKTSALGTATTEPSCTTPIHDELAARLGIRTTPAPGRHTTL